MSHAAGLGAVVYFVASQSAILVKFGVVRRRLFGGEDGEGGLEDGVQGVVSDFVCKDKAEEGGLALGSGEGSSDETGSWFGAAAPVGDGGDGWGWGGQGIGFVGVWPLGDWVFVRMLHLLNAGLGKNSFHRKVAKDAEAARRRPEWNADLTDESDFHGWPSHKISGAWAENGWGRARATHLKPRAGPLLPCLEAPPAGKPEVLDANRAFLRAAVAEDLRRNGVQGR